MAKCTGNYSYIVWYLKSCRVGASLWSVHDVIRTKNKEASWVPCPDTVLMPTALFCSIRKYNYILLHSGNVISCTCVTCVSLYFVLQICFPTIWQINVYSSEVIVHSWSVYMFVCCKPESGRQRLIFSFAIFIFFKAI